MKNILIIIGLFISNFCFSQSLEGGHLSRGLELNTVDSLWNISLSPGSTPDADVVLEDGRLKTIEIYNANTGTQLPLIIYHSADTTGITPIRRGIFLNDTVNHKLYFSEGDKRGSWIILN